MSRGGLGEFAGCKDQPGMIETELFGRTAGVRVTQDRQDHAGRCCSTNCCPARAIRSSTKQMHKKVQARIINDLAERYPMIVGRRPGQARRMLRFLP